MDYKTFAVETYRNKKSTASDLANKLHLDHNFPSGANKKELTEYVKETYNDKELSNAFESVWLSYIKWIDLGRKTNKNRKSLCFSDRTMERVEQVKKEGRFKSDLQVLHFLVLKGLDSLD